MLPLSVRIFIKEEVYYLIQRLSCSSKFSKMIVEISFLQSSLRIPKGIGLFLEFISNLFFLVTVPLLKKKTNKRVPLDCTRDFKKFFDNSNLELIQRGAVQSQKMILALLDNTKWYENIKKSNGLTYNDKQKRFETKHAKFFWGNIPNTL